MAGPMRIHQRPRHQQCVAFSRPSRSQIRCDAQTFRSDQFGLCCIRGRTQHRREASFGEDLQRNVALEHTCLAGNVKYAAQQTPQTTRILPPSYELLVFPLDSDGHVAATSNRLLSQRR
jgi:hypothetical protein